MRVLRPGLLTTVQDLGRVGHQRHGVIVSGAMDEVAHRVANLLVGNEDHAPTLEMTLVGPSLAFDADAVIAICGGDLSATAAGVRLPLWRPIRVRAGTVVEFGGARAGCRAYLAVAGGWDVPLVLGSASTYLRAGIGGHDGRALAAGDVLTWRTPGALASQWLAAPEGDAVAVASWSASHRVRPRYRGDIAVRVMDGPQADWFREESRAAFFEAAFTVGSQSDRMGYRLQGPALALTAPRELLSEAVTMGTVQVPPDGNPILLMADRQTTGGYAKIGQVIRADLPLVAQLKPGDTLRFVRVSVAEAQRLLRRRERDLRELAAAVRGMGAINWRSPARAG
ncbi:biotin-dependent carboxyltransferase family protein [Alicyclobacillus sp.]|uniref:5-oxoprolinase subunit C family protein n=1 Tax=Alicyclobacillus sp. TaxID=61169 RepID=UPI0025C34043|nr:biotin-dependent carboxyltransferase family protein [Alicyclobacillus sp.]MCL6515459.1 biotin-dependent carboxyltransferase family protein [Alicyclobacillus sp.]